MDKLIRRGALIKNLENSGIVDSEDDAWVYSFVIAAIEETPIVDAVPVVHAEWEGKGFNFRCSECGYHEYGQTIDCAKAWWNFCPNCGAKMDGKKVQE